MRAKILITGGTGLVGNKLSEILTEKDYEVIHLSRKENLESRFPAYRWDPSDNYIDKKALDVDYIIHLAGASIADKRWTDKRKHVLHKSRVSSANLLLTSLKSLDKKIKGFISASGVTYYGYDTGDKWVTEDSNPTNEFLAQVVVDWENAADQFENQADQIAKVRTGIVLDDQEGALPQLVRPIRLGAGAPIGSGNQYMSWIHLDDLCHIYVHIIENNLSGVFNGVAPNPVTNKELTQKAARVLKKPLFLPSVPGFALKLVLGELAEILLGGNRVSAEKIQKNGYGFIYEQVDEALKDLLK